MGVRDGPFFSNPGGEQGSGPAISGFILLIAATFAYTCVFRGRGAFIQVGALVGTVMAAKVLIIIIPNQRKTVAALLKAKESNPSGARRRSSAWCITTTRRCHSPAGRRRHLPT
jgi:uncharacterized membrane protein